MPQTPEEKVAQAALLSLLASPCVAHQKETTPETIAGPALKRQKSDNSLKRRVLDAYAGRENKDGNNNRHREHPSSVAPGATPSVRVYAEHMLTNSGPVDIPSIVAVAMNGDPVLPEKVTEARKWLFRNVELVRGKYRGRIATVVGMTKVKYRVRVQGVEHQLEVRLPPSFSV